MYTDHHRSQVLRIFLILHDSITSLCFSNGFGLHSLRRSECVPYTVRFLTIDTPSLQFPAIGTIFSSVPPFTRCTYFNWMPIDSNKTTKFCRCQCTACLSPPPSGGSSSSNAAPNFGTLASPPLFFFHVVFCRTTTGVFSFFVILQPLLIVKLWCEDTSQGVLHVVQPSCNHGQLGWFHQIVRHWCGKQRQHHVVGVHFVRGATNLLVIEQMSRTDGRDEFFQIKDALK